MSRVNLTINVAANQPTRDAGWNEGAHKRDHGKFSGGGGSAAPKKADKPPLAAHQSAPPAAHESAKASAFHRTEAEKAPPGSSRQITHKHVADLHQAAVEHFNRAQNPKRSAESRKAHQELGHRYSGEGAAYRHKYELPSHEKGPHQSAHAYAKG